MATRTIIFAILALMLAYGVFEARPLLLGPSLELQSPVNGQTVPDGLLAISGTATRTVSLTLDGAPLLPDQQGRFAATLAFPSGTSILTLSARDRFGRTVTITRSIFVP